MTFCVQLEKRDEMAASGGASAGFTKNKVKPGVVCSGGVLLEADIED